LPFNNIKHLFHHGAKFVSRCHVSVAKRLQLASRRRLSPIDGRTTTP